MIRSGDMDRAFVEEVMTEPGGEHLITCWSCGTCAATCLVRRYESAFNPRAILHRAGLGLRDAVLSSGEIWQCSACDACYARCPRGIHISDVMGALRNLAVRAGYEAPGASAVSDETLCSGCAVCVRSCPYEAIERVALDGTDRMVAQVNPNLCQRCGVCVAACPTGAMSLESTSDRELLTRMGAGGWLEGKGCLQGEATEPRVLAFVCQWSIHSDAEWSRLQELESDAVRIVNLPCSGRIRPEMLMLALSQGADGVLVVGCREDECHYKRGTYLGRGKLALIQEMMDQMGLPRGRVRFAEAGAADRRVLPRLIADFSRDLAGLTSSATSAATSTVQG
ncbi:MAG TPA: hydrogenase iron-sulfur subunit [Chloroflexi bacterium]|jgi:heterodisulfide reductase subunit C/coenzyme F420-reducing hydrogenase delta subunit|nr:hydrogenase iron-sulfur subunit [Chloroflexota bacterium]